ncbi:hypothetical protein [Brachybacterium hainanense]|uniref:Tetratricopeptide repeat protein n=1 Tax=Brachybacterium hainanense TaxID=1541174 RepID=A0ABV6R771_9MICO
MSASDRTIEDLIAQAEVLPIGPEERSLLEEAFRRAEEDGAEELAYRARMLLTSSQFMAGDTEAMIASFGWCVGRHDTDPVRFPIDPGVHTDLLFQYKWMASTLASHSGFPRERIASLHADMERRYRAAGAGMSGVLQSRHEAALMLGDVEEAGRLIRERSVLDRDRYSHCEACVRADDASYAALTGDDATAIRLWEEILDQDLSCGEEPEFAEARALLPLLRAGRTEDALAAHGRSYRAARGNPDGFPIIARHLVFCAVTGNLARGLQLLERHLPLLAHDPYREADHLEGLASAAVLLEGVIAAGQGATRVRGSDDPTLTPLLGEPEGPRTAQALCEGAWAAAEAIAARFDTRNGNGHMSGLVRTKRELVDLHLDVPLGGADFTPAPVDRSAPTDVLGWIARARMHQHGQDGPAARAAVAEGLALAAAEDAAGGPTHLSAVLHRIRVQLLVQEEQERGTGRAAEDAAIAERVAVLRACGQEEQARIEERLGRLLFGGARAEDLPRLEAELREAEGRGARSMLLTGIAALHLRTPDDLAEPDLGGEESAPEPGRQEEQEMEAAAAAERVLAAAEAAAAALDPADPELLGIGIAQLRAEALARLGRNEEVLAVVEPVLADPRYEGFPRFALQARAAQIRGSRGEYAQGLPHAEAMLADAIQADDAGILVQAAHLTAMLLQDLERPEDAAARLEFALRHAERAEIPTASTRFQLARLQLDGGMPGPALENLETLYLEEKAAQAPPSALAETALHLGRAAMACDEPGMAYRAWEEATDLAEQGEALPLATEAALSLAFLLLRFGDADAVAAFERAVDLASRVPETPGLPSALHGLGRARFAAEDPSALEDLDRAIARATAQGQAWVAADTLDTKGQILVETGQLEAGVAALLGAADGYAGQGDLIAAARGETMAARALQAAERPEEAAAILQTSRDRFPAGSEPRTAIGLELAEVLEELGRTEEAARLREEAS